MSILNVNQLQPVGGGNTITVGSSNIDYSGSITGNISVDGNLTVTGVVYNDDVTNIDSIGIVTARNGINVQGFGINCTGITTSDVGYKFGTNGANYLYESSSDTVSLRVTSDGPYAHFKDVSGNLQMGSASGTLLISAGANEKLRITSAGKISVNNTNPLSDLHVTTADSSGQDGTLRIGGSTVSLGLVLDYDQDGATVSRITANPTYTSNSSLLKICVDGDANPNQLVLKGDGNIGISDVTPENALTIKNIGSFDGDANSFYLGSNFTGTGQNYTGTNKHAQRFFFNNAASNGYLKYENTGTTGNAGNAITWKERFRIHSSGVAQFTTTGTQYPSATVPAFVVNPENPVDGDTSRSVKRSSAVLS